MFARLTPNRMRGSAVFQGLKSLASKLHPQLPLSPKESQRLLTALTSSFRQHLERAHPTQSHGEGGNTVSKHAPGSKKLTESLHTSSADWADKHLASVLTNPLLANSGERKESKIDVTSAKIELHKNPAKDPISLLEEYHKKGAATISIAALCLAKFKESIEGLDAEKRRKAVSETTAGKRILLWLWDSKLYETEAFVNDRNMMRLMVSFVLEEGFESHLWDWIQMDLKLGDQTLEGKRSLGMPKFYYLYRWKGRLLARMVDAKLASSQNLSADSALDVFFKAYQLRRDSGFAEHGGIVLPLAQSGVALNRYLTKNKSARLNTDVARYDRFIELIDFWNDVPIHRRWQRGNLVLVHPQTPSPLPLLQVFEELFDPNVNESNARLREKFFREGEREHFYSTLLSVAAQLHVGGHTEEKKWVVSHIKRLYPGASRKIDEHMKERIDTFLKDSDPEYSAPEQATSPLPVPMPFPTFV